MGKIIFFLKIYKKKKKLKVNYILLLGSLFSWSLSIQSFCVFIQKTLSCIYIHIYKYGLMCYWYIPSFRVQARIPSLSMTTASRLRAVLVYQLAVRKAVTARFFWHMQKHQTASFTACTDFWILPCTWRWLYLMMLQW